MSGIKDKVVAITGASSGIGEATALLLAERGAKLAIGARRSDRLVALADRIAKAGGEAVYAPTDVKRRDDLSNLIKLACERFGKLDVLVNNAGVAPISLLDETPGRRLGGDDRHQPERRSIWHRRRAARVPPSGFRAFVVTDRRLAMLAEPTADWGQSSSPTSRYLQKWRRCSKR